MLFPNRTVPTFDGATPCWRFAMDTFSGVPTWQCSEYRKYLSDNSSVDVFAFCGCHDVVSSNDYCVLCNESSMALTRRDGNNAELSADCSDFMLAANYVVDPMYCQGIQSLAGGLCCNALYTEVIGLSQNEESCSFCESPDTPLMDPDTGIPSKKGFTCAEVRGLASFFHSNSSVCQDELASLAQGCCKSEGRCSLCANPASTILFPDKMLPFSHGERSRCIDVEFHLGYIDSDQCASFHQATSFVDLAAWCGCEVAAMVDTAPSSCSLCGDLDVRQDIAIPDMPHGISCQTFADWAPYVNDATFCETHISLLRSMCCEQTVPDVTEPKMVANLTPSTLAPSTPPLTQPFADSRGNVVVAPFGTIFWLAMALVASLSR